MAKQHRAHPFSGLSQEENAEQSSIQVGNQNLNVNSGWWRGENANFLPNKSGFSDLKSMEEAFLTGWLPQAPFIEHDTKVLTFGSCFAGNIARYLSNAGYSLAAQQGTEDKQNVYVISCNEGIVNTFTMRQMFEWMYLDKRPETTLWHEKSVAAYAFTEENRQDTLALFKDTEVFIITVGLSEVWYDKETGGVYSRAIPRAEYDENRHAFRVSTVEENEENLEVVVNLIREHHPKAKIVVTLSPVPLIATFRPVSCISASSVSKAVLRVAIDQLMRKQGNDGVLHYWPSYEIVTNGFADSFKPDNRHVREEILDYIMGLFERNYCTEQAIGVPSETRLLKARAVSGEIRPAIQKLIEDRDQETVMNAANELVGPAQLDSTILLVESYVAENPDDAEMAEKLKDLFALKLARSTKVSEQNRQRLKERRAAAQARQSR